MFFYRLPLPECNVVLFFVVNFGLSVLFCSNRAVPLVIGTDDAVIAILDVVVNVSVNKTTLSIIIWVNPLKVSVKC